jgi:hypothetical protein
MINHACCMLWVRATAGNAVAPRARIRLRTCKYTQVAPLLCNDFWFKMSFAARFMFHWHALSRPL